MRDEIGAGKDRDHPRQGACRRGVDGEEAGMGVGRAQKDDMEHARQGEIRDEAPAAARQPRRIRPRHGAADIGVRPIERRKPVCLRHPRLLQDRDIPQGKR